MPPFEQWTYLSKVNTPVQYPNFQGINMTPVIARCFERTVYHHYSKKVFERNLAVTQYLYRLQLYGHLDLNTL